MTVRCIMFIVQVISVATFFHYAIKHIWHCQAYGKVDSVFTPTATNIKIGIQ